MQKNSSRLPKTGHEIGALLKEQRKTGGLPETVDRYTSIPAFVSIVTSGELWCSNVRFSNDPDEVAYGRDRIQAVIRQLLPTVKLLGVVSAALDDTDYFGTAFSAERDALPQWRAYCGNGRGIAIGFRVSKLINHRVLLFGQVEYDPGRQVMLIHQLLERFGKTANDGFLSTWTKVSRLVRGPGDAIVALAGLMKDAAYASEREYRLFKLLPRMRYPRGQRIYFRPTPTMVIPYIKERFNRRGELPLDEVIVGPTLDSDLAIESVRSLLADNGYRFVDVMRSSVKMRT